MFEFLKSASDYGLIDIFFGIGIPAFLWSLIRKRAPRNYPYLHVSVSEGHSDFIPPNHQNLCAIIFSISNSGNSNFYIARAYFIPTRSSWITLFLAIKTPIKVHPFSDKIADKNNAFELKFISDDPIIFTEYETIIRPSHKNRKQTFLALTEPLTLEMIQNRNCGTLYIDYATREFQGTHKIRV